MDSVGRKRKPHDYGPPKIGGYMKSEAEQILIETLTRKLSNLEREARIIRSDLKRMLRNKELRRCQVEIYWDITQEMYVTKYSRDGIALFMDKSKRYAKGHASVGIESVDGERPRVSWKQIDSGTPWIVSAIVQDYYWDRYIEPEYVPPSKVLSLDTFKALRRH